MSAAVKTSSKEDVNNIPRHLIIYISGRKRAYIGIIVPPGHLRDLFIPADRTTHSGMLIGGHVDPVSRTADRNSYPVSSFTYCFPQLMTKVRIIDSFSTIGSNIHNFNTLLLQVLLQHLLDLKTSM